MNESMPGFLLYFDDLRLINTLSAEDKSLIFSSLEALEGGTPETPDSISDTGKVVLHNIINKAMKAQGRYHDTQRRKLEGAFFGQILSENGKSKDQLTPEEERLYRIQASARYIENTKLTGYPMGTPQVTPGYPPDNIKQDNINKNNINEHNKNPDASAEECFIQFWERYPNKTGRGAAREAFLKINPDQETFSKIISAIESMSKTEAWTEEGGRYIPNPAKWLQEERWKDDPPKPRTKTVTEQKYDQRPNTENGAEGVPEWLLNYRREKEGGTTA